MIIQGYAVRGATVADIPAVVDFMSGLFIEDGAARDPNRDATWPSRGGRDYVHDILGDDTSLLLVAEHSGEPVGYLVGRSGRGGDTRLRSVAVLESLFVDPAHRSGGAGAALVERFRAWAADTGAYSAAVTAHVANERGIAFYQRMGFHPAELTLEQRLD